MNAACVSPSAAVRGAKRTLVSERRILSYCSCYAQSVIKRPQRPVTDSQAKLHAVRRSAEYSFPTADIDEMLDDIERGYLAGAEVS